MEQLNAKVYYDDKIQSIVVDLQGNRIFCQAINKPLNHSVRFKNGSIQSPMWINFTDDTKKESVIYSEYEGEQISFEKMVFVNFNTSLKLRIQ
jgi:hypothetical protein